ncbi:MAG: mechanosensitive ion channel family protein [Gemmatimonadota bacterium]
MTALAGVLAIPLVAFTLFAAQAPVPAEPSLTVMGVDLLSPEARGNLIRAVLLILLGLPAIYGASRWLRAYVSRLSSPQRGMVFGKVLFYAGSVVLLVTVFSQLGFSLTPLLGAAGILGIAIGFASQTSVSNIISGLFLIAEQPFVVDDVIQVGDTVGRVLSIDTLSVKLRTFDNKFVRIPNENIIKNQVTTITRFPIRRVDLDVGIAYKEDVARVREVLLEVAHANPQSLVEPAPMVNVIGFGDSSVDLRVVAWATKENWLQLKNGLQEEIKARFDQEGIEIPFPHRTLYTGEVTRPFPIRHIPVETGETGEPDDPRWHGEPGEPGERGEDAGAATRGAPNDRPHNTRKKP